MSTAAVMLDILIKYRSLYLFTATGCEVIEQRGAAYYSSQGHIDHNPIKVLQETVTSLGGLTKITCFHHLPE